MAHTKKLSPEETHWQTVIDAANSLYKEGRYEDAETKFAEAVTAAEAFGEEDHRLATTLNNLGLLYYAQKKYTEAEPLYKKAISIREQSLGKEHLMVAMSLSNLSLLYYAQKKFSKAAPICKRALSIREKLLDENHLDIALSLNNLALIYHGQEADKKAEPLCERALEIREAHLPKGHALILASMKNLLKIYKALESKEKAKALTQRIAAVEKKAPKKSKSMETTAQDIIPALEEKPIVTTSPRLRAAIDDLGDTHAPLSDSCPQKRRLGFTRTLGETSRRDRLNRQHGKRVWGWSQRSFTHS
jgi:tetratricopeptide (TPR) repeat protein